MTKTHKSILPIIAIIFGLIFGWSTSCAQTAEKLENQLREVKNLPSGSVFQLTLTDEDATKAAAEYLTIYMERIQNMIVNTVGIKLDFSDPEIDFDDERIIVSIRGGIGFLKIKASASGKVEWDTSTQTLKVDIQSVDIPIISVDPATVTSYIQGPLNEFIHSILGSYEILAFNIHDGYAVLDARKR